MKRFQNILAAVETESEHRPALEWAAVLAEHNRARLKIVDVVPEFGWALRLTMPGHAAAHGKVLAAKQERLESLAAPLREKGLQVTARALSGTSSVEIIREVLRDGHDLVVRVSKGRHSPREGFFGSTTTRLLRNCPCPVWAVEPDSAPQFVRVLAAVDPVPHDPEHAQLNKTVMELARSIAEREQGEFHVVYVWSLFGESVLASHMSEEEFHEVQSAAEAQATAAFNGLLGEFGLSVGMENVHLVKGEPGRAINELIQGKAIDLLVLGTVGRSGMSGLLMGNTAEAVLSHIQCAVLAVKPEGFVSPITLNG
ncbi:MAG: universal stress protein [Planctomycetes bacterium]|nr:universal stress protein [Planctomycetota bacterium]